VGQNRIITIKDMQEAAAKRNGKCLSETYIRASSKLLWECEKGHQWWATPNSVTNSQQTWCKTCKGLNKKTIEEMQEIARLKGGKCLSTEYLGGKHKLQWECADKHTWWALPSNISSGKSWCPHCPKHIGEEKCRYILKTLLGKSFKKTRKVIEPYELDGYNNELSLAFEYHGRQHYEFNKFFHGKIEKFEKQLKADIEKLEFCNLKGIQLIVVPYWENEKNDEYLVEWFKEKIIQLGYSLVTEYVDMEPFYLTLSTLNDLKKIAEKRGGKCLSSTYVSNDTHLLWECREGHQWKAKPSNIARHWCRPCSIQERKQVRHREAFDRFTKLAEVYEGKLLSKAFTTIHEEYEWECRRGHRFKKVANVLKQSIERRNVFCAVCSEVEKKEQRRLDKFKKAQIIAESHNGRCNSLDIDYVDKPISFTCEKGHTFSLSLKAASKGSWCAFNQCKMGEEEYKQYKEKLAVQNRKKKWGKCFELFVQANDDGYSDEIMRWIEKQRRDYKVGILDSWQINLLEGVQFDWEDNSEWLAMIESWCIHQKEIENRTEFIEITPELQLSSWIAAQKRRLKRGSLAEIKSKELSRLGILRSQEEEGWISKIRDLALYKKLYGDCLVPGKFEPFPPLGRWVMQLRMNYRKGVLSKEKIKQLERMGFVWEVYEDKWENMLNALNEFKKENGHANVPNVYPKNPKLANFCIARKIEYKNGSIKPERKQNLDELGFMWEPYEESWFEKFNELIKYKERFGDTLVPRKYEENALYGWVRNQRTHYKTGKLSQERVDLLNEIEFVWDQYEYQWNIYFDEIKEFYNKTGSFSVPKVTYKQLNEWVNGQRKNVKLGKISFERYKLLDKIGFWKPHEKEVYEKMEK
jgi:Helicase associated domain